MLARSRTLLLCGVLSACSGKDSVTAPILAITTTNVAAGIVGAAYSQSNSKRQAEMGATSWSVVSGSLPAGPSAVEFRCIERNTHHRFDEQLHRGSDERNGDRDTGVDRDGDLSACRDLNSEPPSRNRWHGVHANGSSDWWNWELYMERSERLHPGWTDAFNDRVLSRNTHHRRDKRF